MYDNTAEKSPVGRFLAGWAAHRGSLSRDWFQDRTIYPIDSTIDLSLALHHRCSTGTTYCSGDFWERRSRYHVDVAVAVASSSRKEERATLAE